MQYDSFAFALAIHRPRLFLFDVMDEPNALIKVVEGEETWAGRGSERCRGGWMDEVVEHCIWMCTGAEFHVDSKIKGTSLWQKQL